VRDRDFVAVRRTSYFERAAYSSGVLARLSSHDSSLVRAHYPAWNEVRFGVFEQFAPQRFADGLGLPELFIGRRTWSGVEDAGGATFLSAGHEAMAMQVTGRFPRQQVMYQLFATRKRQRLAWTPRLLANM
jgi:hypothetical protein